MGAGLKRPPMEEATTPETRGRGTAPTDHSNDVATVLGMASTTAKHEGPMEWLRSQLSRRIDWPLVLLIAVFVLFRLPALVNAGWTNSDGAVTGLQALQIARGEWTWLHWGRFYLLSLDSVMLVPFFAVFGATPVTMMCVTILAQFVSTGLIFSTLRNRVGVWPAFAAVLPTVFVTMALNIYLFFAIRQWCLALMMFAWWILDRASDARRSLANYAIGVFLGGLALFVDLFAIQLLPGLALLAFLCCFDGGRTVERKVERWLARLGVVAVSGATALLVVRALEHVAGVSTERAGWDVNLIPHNFQMLQDTCLPWVVGTKIFAITDIWPYQQNLGSFFTFVQKVGTLIFVAGLLSGAALGYVPQIPWKIRRLGIVGTAQGAVSLLGFLGSPTVSDIWASRMLYPLILSVPFALAPAAYLFRSWRFPVVLSPYLLMIIVAGWRSYGHFADGWLPAGTPRGTADDEAELAQALRERGIKYATGQYWLAYRLTFLFNENPIVVPLDSEDRYPRYKEEFDKASRVAYVFHPSQPWQSPHEYGASLSKQYKSMETLQIKDFKVFIVNRAQ